MILGMVPCPDISREIKQWNWIKASDFLKQTGSSFKYNMFYNILFHFLCVRLPYIN
jgi:hypothetical protein